MNGISNMIFARFPRAVALALATLWLLPAGGSADGYDPPAAASGALSPASHGSRHSSLSSSADPYTRGLLWKVESQGHEPSYLLGTIHSDDPRVVRLPDPVRQIFDRSDSFTMEMIPDGDGIVRMAEALYFKDGRTLKAVIGEELYAQAKAAIEYRGLPTADLARKKPWAIVMALSVPTAKTGMFLDLALQMQATLQDKPTYGLESMDEQLSVFDDMPMQDQIALLREALRIYREIDQQTEELIQAYLARDLKRLMEIVGEFRPDNQRAYDSMMTRLLTQRNLKMAERMQPRLREGNAFIAVGAAHLSGDHGLLHLLARQGYRLTPIY